MEGTTLSKYTPAQQANVVALVNEAHTKGITNEFAVPAILSIVSKESGFNYKSESSYAHTSNAQIRKIFSSRVAMLSEAQLTALKVNDVAFFDTIYGYKTESGRKNGNTLPGDGWKYRGRGPNQITYKNLYAKLGKQIGVDLVGNPDLANTPKVAAKVAIQYFLNSFASAPKAELALYHSTGINDFKSLPDSVGAFYHANAGWGHTKAQLDLDPTHGQAKAKLASNDFYTFVSNNKVAVASGGGGFFLVTSLLIIWAVSRKKKKQAKK